MHTVPLLSDDRASLLQPPPSAGNKRDQTMIEMAQLPPRWCVQWMLHIDYDDEHVGWILWMRWVDHERNDNDDDDEIGRR